MNDYVLSCCSTVDLTREKLESRDIRWLPFHFELDGVDHLDDFGETMSYQDFYDAMKQAVRPKRPKSTSRSTRITSRKSSRKATTFSTYRSRPACLVP